MLDRYAAGEQAVHALVLGEGVLRLRAQQAGDGLLDHARRQVGIDAERRVPETPGQDYVVVRRALGRCAAGREDGPGQGGVADERNQSSAACSTTP